MVSSATASCHYRPPSPRLIVASGSLAPCVGHPAPGDTPHIGVISNPTRPDLVKHACIQPAPVVRMDGATATKNLFWQLLPADSAGQNDKYGLEDQTCIKPFATSTWTTAVAPARQSRDLRQQWLDLSPEFVGNLTSLYLFFRNHGPVLQCKTFKTAALYLRTVRPNVCALPHILSIL